MAEMKNKMLVLENGTVFEGFGFGADRDAVAELVFNTSMVGYQEIVSENSYYEQMVVLTYPIIGSYGVNDEDDECKNPNIGGLIVRDYNDMPSNFRYTKTLSEAMEEDNIPGIHGLDTRALTRLIRDNGTMKAMITSIDTPVEEALAAIAAWKPSTDAVAKVSCRKRFNIPMTEDFSVWDLSKEYTIDPEDFLSKGRATPFAGWKVSGENLMTIVGGKIVWQK